MSCAQRQACLTLVQRLQKTIGECVLELSQIARAPNQAMRTTKRLLPTASLPDKATGDQQAGPGKALQGDSVDAGAIDAAGVQAESGADLGTLELEVRGASTAQLRCTRRRRTDLVRVRHLLGGLARLAPLQSLEQALQSPPPSGSCRWRTCREACTLSTPRRTRPTSTSLGNH